MTQPALSSHDNRRAPLPDSLAEATVSLHQVSMVKCLSHLKDRASFVAYLTQTYHYVVASVPLMETACRTAFARDNEFFSRYLARHIEEESGHDEWLLRDLAALGIEAESVRNSLPLPEVAQLAGAQYYTIEHLHPVGILGYIYALEAAPPNSAFIAHLARQCDLPDDALFTLREHGASDTSHTNALISVLTRHHYTNFQEETILYSAQNALRSVIGMWNSLAARAPAQ